VTGVMDLQQSLYDIYSKIIILPRPIDDTLSAALIPHVIEAFNLYQLAVIILKQIVNGKKNE
jgi:hypothetical protein